MMGGIGCSRRERDSRGWGRGWWWGAVGEGRRGGVWGFVEGGE